MTPGAIIAEQLSNMPTKAEKVSNVVKKRKETPTVTPSSNRKGKKKLTSKELKGKDLKVYVLIFQSKSHYTLFLFTEVPSVKNGLSFVARDGMNEKTSIVMEDEDDTSDETVGTKANPVKLVGKKVKFCALCRSQGKFCHEKRYRDFCLKAVYSHLKNSTKTTSHAENWTACSKETIVGVFTFAYNYKRKGDLEDRFGYFNCNWMNLPKCMEKNSLEQAIGINFNPGLIHTLKLKNEEGYKRYCMAKADYSA